jgi:hypothetical protein
MNFDSLPFTPSPPYGRLLQSIKITKDSAATSESGVLDASPGSLLHLCDGTLCHRLKGDLGVLAPETCQHMLYHCLGQSTTLYLWLSTDDLQQLQLLGPSGVKQWEHNTDLFHRISSPIGD